nr:MAG TPA: holin [Caudoviricetes sp.]
MKNAGMTAALAGVFSVCMAVGSEPIAVEAGIVGLVIMVVGLAMVLYQSYREEESAEIERRRKRLFRTWEKETDLKRR